MLCSYVDCVWIEKKHWTGKLFKVSSIDILDIYCFLIKTAVRYHTAYTADPNGLVVEGELLNDTSLSHPFHSLRLIEERWRIEKKDFFFIFRKNGNLL